MFQVYVLKCKTENGFIDRYIKKASYRNITYTTKIMEAASFSDASELKSYLNVNEINPMEFQVVLLQMIDVVL